jgi:hypothetical protein
VERFMVPSILLRRGRLRGAVVTLAAAAMLAPLAALAQADGIDPRATDLLRRSTAFVAKQQRLEVDTVSSIEIVLAGGQKIQFGQTTRMALQRPDRFRAERTGDVIAQVLYYDGRTLTLSSPKDSVYATLPAPGTIEATLDLARTKLDLVAPAGDLLSVNAYDILMTDVTQGFVVGKATVEGVRCDHLAFRAPHVDWQIWIEDGPRPLPRKLVITTRDVVNAPQFSVVATKWDLAPTFGPATFAFKPAAGARRIDFLPLP